MLVQDLNKALSDQSLFNELIKTEPCLKKDTMSLLAEKPQGEERVRLNAWFWRSAFRKSSR